MKTINTFKLSIVSLFVAGFMVSCNQSPKTNKANDNMADTAAIMNMHNSGYNESVLQSQREMNRIWMQLDSLDETDPDFNKKLDRRLDEFNATMDSLGDNLREKGHDLDHDANKRYDELRFQSKELKDKLKRWSDKTGDNLDELGNDIKTNFRKFKDSLKSDNE